MRLAWPARAVRGGVVVALAAGLAACGGDDPMMQPVNECVANPRTPGVEVIDQVQYDASLSIDLAQMTVLASGVYIQDISAGTGAILADGNGVSVNYTGWLSNGCEFDMGQSFGFVYPDAGFIQGWNFGMEGQQVGATRRIIIPPDLGYGSQDFAVIPGGSVLIFEIELLTVS